ncbi:MAG: hypothetical protein GY906_24640 [bacterium]|nr:hypothetical protein [bacterium]
MDKSQSEAAPEEEAVALQETTVAVSRAVIALDDLLPDGELASVAAYQHTRLICTGNIW